LSRWKQAGHGWSNQRAGCGSPFRDEVTAAGSQYRQSGHVLTSVTLAPGVDTVEGLEAHCGRGAGRAR
jgi:hypothetical protein